MLFVALYAYILRNLIKPELIGAQDPHIIRKSFVGVLSYSLGVATAWFSVHAAFVIYMITPLFFITPPQARRVAQSEVASASPRETRR
jgi:hypothetical protein